MLILFCAFQDGLREPDPEFLKEQLAAEELGIGWRVFSLEDFLRGAFERAFRFLLPGGGDERLLYRGYILKAPEYETLDRELKARGYRLITDPSSYRRCTALPDYFGCVTDLTVPAIWCEGVNSRQAWREAKKRWAPPYVVKDYVKSAKEIWEEGCYVPADADFACFEQIVERLVDYRGDRFDTGLVVRPFVPLRHLDVNPFGGEIFEEFA